MLLGSQKGYGWHFKKDGYHLSLLIVLSSIQSSEDSQILQAKAHLEGDPALEHLRALVVDGSLVDHSKRGASSDRGEDLGHAETIISELQWINVCAYVYYNMDINEVFSEISSPHKNIKDD